MVTKLTLEYDGSGFAGWARQPGSAPCRRSSSGAAHDPRGARPRRRAARADRGRAHRPRRARVGRRWPATRHEAVDPLRLNALLADDVAVLAAEPAPGRLRRAPRRAQPHLLLPRARAARAQRVRARPRASGGQARSTARRSRECARRCAGARLHSLHADRDRALALRARRAGAPSGGCDRDGAARVLDRGATPSCAT